jgi:hypothetical protein
MKSCIHCNTQLPDDAAFCFNCGKEQIQVAEKLDKQIMNNCPRCNTPINQPGEEFCHACGFPLTTHVGIPPTPESVPSQVNQKPPILEQTDLKTFSGKKSSKPAEKAAKKTPMRKLPVRKIGWVLVGLFAIGILSIGGWFLWQKLSGGTTQSAEVEACRPAEIPEDYEVANQKDLEGDLLRNSYFRAGEEYSIAPNATFRVPKGLTLIIQPGVRVRFGEGAKFVVEGTLSACGRSSRRILFTADTDAGRPGFWSGIELSDAENGTTLGYANVEFAGKDNHAAIRIQGSNIHLENILFSSNQWYPFSLDPNSEPSLLGPFNVESGLPDWEVRGGDLTGTRTWNFNQTIVVNGVVTIIEDARLTLPESSVIKFLPQSALKVLGALIAQGTTSQKIVLTSVNDGGEEGSPQPKAGDWVGVGWFGRKNNSHLAYVEVRYAGGQAPDGRTYAALYMEDAAPQLESVSVRSCESFALSTDLSSSPQIKDLSIDTVDPLKRWVLRESKLEDVSTYTLSSLETTDGARLDPLVTGWLGVAEKAILIIDPDTHLLFKNGDRSGLWADGVLKINGTKQEPVVMTSWYDPLVGGSGQPSAGDWGGIQINRGQPDKTVVSELIIRYAGAAENTCLRLLESSARLENVSIEHCAGYPLSSYATAQPVIENLVLTDNALGNIWEIRGSDLIERRTWIWAPVSLENDQVLVRRITGRIVVDKEATLELAPGLALAFSKDGYLLVRGGIQAPGTLKEPILLTSWRDGEINPVEGGAQPGDWPGLILDGEREGQVLQNIKIHYGGATNQGISCLYLNKASPSVNNVEISYCSYYPISSDLNSNPSIGEISLTDNQLENAWVVRESTLTNGSSQKWQVIQQAGGGGELTRLVTGRLTIEGGAKLELGPGVVLRFSQGTGIVVNGSLLVNASQQSPVVLTSWRDPEYSNEGGVQAGDWSCLYLDASQGDVNLDWLEIRYAGGGEGALKLNNAAPKLGHILIRDSASYPISIEIQSNPQWGQVTLHDNNPANVVEVRSSSLERSGEQTWGSLSLTDGSEIVRLVTGMVVIAENATLRVDPLAVVKFTEEGGLEVRGGLSADEAVFTSFHDDDFGGKTDSAISGELTWKGIRLLTQKPVQLQDFTLRFAETGLWLENAAPVLSNVLIEGCTQAAISADLLSTPHIENVTLQGSAINGLVLRATELPDGETRWSQLGNGNQVVRVLLETLTIGPRSQLSIEESAVIKFGLQVSIIVEGQLTVSGREESPVVFTALSDDGAGGDSDNLQSPPNRGAWVGLIINPNNTGARLSLINADILYAANGLYLVNMPEWTYNGLVISDSQFYGISCDELSAFIIEADNIQFINNGSESLSCPTPDR